MQQPLAHLYFLTLLEHLQVQKRKLPDLVRLAIYITQQCTSPDTRKVEAILLWVEHQAVVQVIMQKLAFHLDPSECHMGEIQSLTEEINR